MRRRVNLKMIPLISAFVQTHASLRQLDEVVFARLKLEVIDVKRAVDRSRIEQKGMRRNGEQRLGQLRD